MVVPFPGGGWLVSVLLFLVGLGVVVWSVEAFIDAVAKSALSFGLSGFLFAVVLAGIDLENLVLGVVAAYGGLSDLALGTVFGEAVFVLAVAVGLAGVLVPFETAVPRPYVLLTAAAPIPMFLLALDGTLGWIEGLVLTALFVPALGAVYALERRASTRYVVAAEVEEVLGADGTAAADSTADPEPNDGRSGWYHLGIAVLATVGMTVGSAVAVGGAEGILRALDLSGLVFGATVMSFIASLEELFLTVEPARQGRPGIAVGNVVGSTLFYVTANVGLIALIGPVATAGPAMAIQWLFFFAALALVVLAFTRGRVARAGGVALLALYAAYWIANYSPLAG